jgi:hypothetical protein
VAYNPWNPGTWPAATIVIRGGTRDLEHLANVATRDGSWSVISAPGIPFGVLARSVRNGTVRRTSVRRVLAAGGRLTPSRGSETPPFHCNLSRLTPAAFDAILGPEEPNPVRATDRWRGNER